jgi:hypothetical protein
VVVQQLDVPLTVVYWQVSQVGPADVQPLPNGSHCRLLQVRNSHDALNAQLTSHAHESPQSTPRHEF